MTRDGWRTLAALRMSWMSGSLIQAFRLLEEQAQHDLDELREMIREEQLAAGCQEPVNPGATEPVAEAAP